MSISFVKSEVYTRKKQQRRFPENIRAIKDRIYVGGIPKDVEERELGDFFSSFGVVTHAGIVPSSNNPGNWRYGFVTFQEGESVVQRLLSGHEGDLVLRGCPLVVGPARERNGGHSAASSSKSGSWVRDNSHSQEWKQESYSSGCGSFSSGCGTTYSSGCGTYGSGCGSYRSGCGTTYSSGCGTYGSGCGTSVMSGDMGGYREDTEYWEEAPSVDCSYYYPYSEDQWAPTQYWLPPPTYTVQEQQVQDQWEVQQQQQQHEIFPGTVQGGVWEVQTQEQPSFPSYYYQGWNPAM